MKSKKFRPVIDKVYENKGGGLYRCIYYAADNVPVMQNVNTGWTLKANGICVYEDGKIEWDYSTEGHFEEV